MKALNKGNAYFYTLQWVAEGIMFLTRLSVSQSVSHVFLSAERLWKRNRIWWKFVQQDSKNILMVLAHLSWRLKWTFFDQNLCVVCHGHCPRRCSKLFTFSSSSPEPLGKFQPNFSQDILGYRGFKFVQIKGPALFKGEIITNSEIHWYI